MHLNDREKGFVVPLPKPGAPKNTVKVQLLGVAPFLDELRK